CSTSGVEHSSLIFPCVVLEIPFHAYMNFHKGFAAFLCIINLDSLLSLKYCVI
ncbi:hypothetical protein L9F63_007057, partial [Diploptera punctata]